MAENTIRLDVDRVLPSLVVLLQNVVDNMFTPPESRCPDEDTVPVTMVDVHYTIMNINIIMASVLHDFRIAHASALLLADLGWWVLSRSTTWFSRFVMHEFDDNRWIRHFRTTKSSVISLAGILRPHIEKQDMKYRLAISVMDVVQVERRRHGA